MSGIYYVYLKPMGENSTRSSDFTCYLLTFRSRWDSDELFRGLQTIKTAKDDNSFTLLRVNSQFWCYDTTLRDYCWPISWVHSENALHEFKYKFMATGLGGTGAGRDWPVLTNPTIGPDWVSGNTFYIRNRREPDLYWHCDYREILISPDRRTKFRIKDEDSDDERVLIRKDKVTIEPVGSLGTPIGMYVTKNEDSERLSVGSTRQVWTFSDLFDSVGVAWAADFGLGGARFAFATSLPDLGDEWELC